MQICYVNRSQLSGTCRLPASKSQSMRALLFAALAEGVSELSGLLPSPDIQAMMRACEQIGARMSERGQILSVQGIAGQLTDLSGQVIDAGNSGQVLRFMACMAALQAGECVLTGDHSICTRRPVTPLLEALPLLGAECEAIDANQHAPIRVKGPLIYRKTTLCGQDSQPVSGLLMAAPFSSQGIALTVRSAGEKPWIDLTLSWLDRCKIAYQRQGYDFFEIEGNQSISAFNYHVPGDLSTLSFPLVAALITESPLTISGLDLSEPQGDKALIDIVRQMGADVRYDAARQQCMVMPSQRLQGIDVDINHCIDTIAILAVLACFAQGDSVIRGARIARKKECDRLAVMTAQLNRMGGCVRETEDGLHISPRRLQAARLSAHADHRVAMALAVAAMACDGQSEIIGSECMMKSYPQFVADFQALGAQISQEVTDA